MNDPYAPCECGHGYLAHEGEYGCLDCECSSIYPIPGDDNE